MTKTAAFNKDVWGCGCALLNDRCCVELLRLFVCCMHCVSCTEMFISEKFVLLDKKNSLPTSKQKTTYEKMEVQLK